MNGWRTRALSDICEINIGRTPSRAEPEYWGSGSPWLSIADMNQGRDLRATKEQISDKAIQEVMSDPPLAPGTVVLSFKLSIGKVGIVRTPMFTNEAIAALPIRQPTEVDVNFLYWALRSINLLRETDDAVMGKTLNKTKLARTQVPVPPIAEQRRIAEILDQAEALRAKRRQEIALLDDLANSIFVDIFNDPNAGGIVRLGEVAEVVSGITKGRKLPNGDLREIPYLAVLNVQDKRLDLGTIKVIEATGAEIEKYRLRKHDLLLTEGGDPDKLGRGTLWNDELTEAIHQNHIFRVRLYSGTPIDPLYLNWELSSERGKRYFLKSAKQTTGIASINKAQLRNFPIRIPPRDTQKHFVNKIAKITKLHKNHELSLARFDELFASLQARAFRGQL